MWDKVKELVLEQYKSSPNLKGLIQSVVEECAQTIDDAAFSIQDFFDVSKATAGWLDILGKYVSLERNPGESDESFRERIVIEASTNTAGTPDNIIFNSAILSGDPKTQYMDEADCTFFVYTGPKPNHEPVPEDEVFDFEHGDTSCGEGADQLYRRQVKKLAPCGVLGLPGAAIQVGGDEGSEELLADEQGRLILMEADDSTVERTLVLANEDALPVVTPNGVPVRAVVKGTTVPTIPVTLDGHQYDAVRIKDLPDAGNENGYIVRDSESGGTVKTDALTEEEFDTLWDETPAEEDDSEDNG